MMVAGPEPSQHHCQPLSSDDPGARKSGASRGLQPSRQESSPVPSVSAGRREETAGMRAGGGSSQTELRARCQRHE